MRGCGRRNALLTCGLLSAGLIGSGVAFSTPARADITSDQAASLQGQIHGWLEGLLGPNVPLSSNPVLVKPEGDHYRLSVAIGGQYGVVNVTGDAVTALVKPLDANRWAVDDFRLPSPLKIENTGPSKDMFKSWTAKIAEQTGKGVVDLSFATTSSLDQTMRGYSTVSESVSGQKSSHVDHTTSHNTIQPAGDGRVNLLIDGGGEHLSSESALPDGSALKVTTDTFKVTGHADKVSFAQIGAAIKLGTGLIPLIQQASAAAKADAGKEKAGSGAIAKKEGSTDDDDDSDQASSDAGASAKPSQSIPAAARGPLHDLVRVMRDALGGFEEQVAMEKFKIQSDQFNGSVAHLITGIGFGAPDGKLDAHMMFGMDGIDSPMIPPGVYHDYVPRHFSFRPRISGVPTNDLAQFVDHAIDSDGGDSSALEMEAMGLLAKGPLAVGIDDLSFEMGPAALKSAGSLSISSPADYSGQAEIRVTGFDKLIQQANTKPELKQGAPVLIFLKGVGKQEGNAIIWNVTYQDKTLLVNGTNLSAMMPGNDGSK